MAKIFLCIILSSVKSVKKTEAFLYTKTRAFGRGRLNDNVQRAKKSVTVQLYIDNYDYLMDRYRNISSIVNDLIDKDRAENNQSDG